MFNVWLTFSSYSCKILTQNKTFPYLTSSGIYDKCDHFNLCHLLAEERYCTGGMCHHTPISRWLRGQEGKGFQQGDYRSHRSRSSAIGKIGEMTLERLTLEIGVRTWSKNDNTVTEILREDPKQEVEHPLCKNQSFFFKWFKKHKKSSKGHNYHLIKLITSIKKFGFKKSCPNVV